MQTFAVLKIIILLWKICLEATVTVHFKAGYFLKICFHFSECQKLAWNIFSFLQFEGNWCTQIKENQKKGGNAHTEISFEKNQKDTLVWPSIDIEKLIVCIWIHFFAPLTTKLWWCDGHVVCLWNGRSGFKSRLGNSIFLHFSFAFSITFHFVFLLFLLKKSGFSFLCTFRKLKTSY